MKNMNGYYITRENPTVKVTLEPQYEIILVNMDLIELVLPQCKNVWCFSNLLEELILPEGCELVDCSFNKLTKLIIPKSVRKIICYTNHLSKLIIPNNCKYISCCDNKLTELIVSKNCEYINCSNNIFNKIIENLLLSCDPIKISLANNLQLANNVQK